MVSLFFVNVTDSPKLDLSETKRLRAHVTKKNFANRRRRLVEQKQKEDSELDQEWRNKDDHDRKNLTQSPQRRRPLSDWPKVHSSDMFSPFRISPNADSSVNYLLLEFRPIIFPSGNGDRGTHNERMWIDMFLSEPALLEASMAISAGRYPFSSERMKSDIHAYRAVQLVNKRLQNPETMLQDGVLAAVFTLGFREEIAHNRDAKLAHNNGLSQMLRLRRSRAAKNDVPPWFSDLILYEAIGQSLRSTWDASEGTYALFGDNVRTVKDVSRVSRAIEMLLEPIDAYRRGILKGDTTEKAIQRQINRLHELIAPLFESKGSYVRALAHSLRIFIHLLWRDDDEINLGYLATELRQILMGSTIRFCTSIQLTLWQFFIGVVASRKGSEDRVWFMDRLTLMLSRVNIQTWDEMKQVIKQTFQADASLWEEFRGVWVEVVSRQHDCA